MIILRVIRKEAHNSDVEALIAPFIWSVYRANSRLSETGAGIGNNYLA